MVQLSHPYMTNGKTIALIIWTFVSKVISLFFDMLSRFVKASLPRIGKHLLISWLQSLSTVILEPKKIKSGIASTFSLFICHEVMGLDAMVLVFECWLSSQLFHSPLSPSSRGSLIPLHFLPLKWYHLHIWGCCYFSQQSWLQLVIHSPNILHDVLCIEVKQTGWQYTALTYSFPNLELASCSTFSSKCCFLTRIQVSQETGKVICSWHNKVFFRSSHHRIFAWAFPSAWRVSFSTLPILHLQI